MSVFDVLFYVVCLLAFLLLAAIVRLLLLGNRRGALRPLGALGVLIAVYGAAILATKLATPVAVYSVGSWQVSGDWYLIVDGWYPEPQGDQKGIAVNFKLISRADHDDVSEKGLVAYILDDDGVRYDAMPEPSTPPFDVVLKPGKTVITTRRFLLQGDPQKLEVVVAHHGFRRTWFVIGRTPFDGSSVVQLQ